MHLAPMVAHPTPMSSSANHATAPVRPGEILRQIGPGLIITATIVGSGELVVTPKLGAGAGFTLLWFMIAACVLKVFIQVEIGRHTVTTGRSSLRTMDLMPGPRLRVSWLLWLWVPMFAATVFQIAGMLGGIASILSLAGAALPKPLLAAGVGVFTAGLLVLGRYRVIEAASTWMVVAFTVCTVGAVGALQFTPFAVTGADLAEGFSFKLPPSFTVAFAAFGVIGVGASELIYYPYWLLEKGYARRVGVADGTPGWRERARGWIRVLHADVWTSCLIYTGATLAFYVLGAAILKRKGLDVTNADMIPALSQMYIETFGAWSLWLFLIGAAAVLYSTVFGATAANVRLVADALEVFGVKKHRDEADRQRTLLQLSVAFPVIWTTIYLFWGEPVTLVFVGAVAQGLMLPFLGFLALYLHHRHTPEGLRPGVPWRAGLWLSATCMAVAGGYQVVSRFLS